jgi:hypothetical protein
LAVAAAEPQWVHPQAVDATHLKTPSGDTVSVQAHKIQHHQLKAAEYAKKGYVSYAHTNKVVAAPIYSAPATYAAATFPNTYTNKIVAAPVSTAAYSIRAPYAAATVPAFNTGVYSPYGLHHLGKREADSDSQMVYSTAYGGYPQINRAAYNNVYNAGIYGAAYPATHTYNTGMYSAFPNTYYSGYTHKLGKRDADSDPHHTQMAYTNAYAGVHPYYNNVYNTGVYGAYSGLTAVAPVATSVYNVPATYAAATPPYTSGVYSGIHHLGKREAEADSQNYTNAYAGVSPYYNNAYNTARVYGGYTGYTGFPYSTYGNVMNRFHY